MATSKYYGRKIRRVKEEECANILIASLATGDSFLTNPKSRISPVSPISCNEASSPLSPSFLNNPRMTSRFCLSVKSQNHFLHSFSESFTIRGIQAFSGIFLAHSGGDKVIAVIIDFI